MATYTWPNVMETFWRSLSISSKHDHKFCLSDRAEWNERCEPCLPILFIDFISVNGCDWDMPAYAEIRTEIRCENAIYLIGANDPEVVAREQLSTDAWCTLLIRPVFKCFRSRHKFKRSITVNLGSIPIKGDPCYASFININRAWLKTGGDMNRSLNEVPYTQIEYRKIWCAIWMVRCENYSQYLFLLSFLHILDIPMLQPPRLCQNTLCCSKVSTTFSRG